MSLSRRSILAAALALPAVGGLLTIWPHSARAKTDRVYTEDGIAVDGTDVVAYFKEQRPVAGKPELSHKWNGATWRFSSAENRDEFAAEPDRYAPQYGGYCAYAVSEGYTASTVPEAWKIVDGKLYLNFSRRIQRRWERNEAERIRNANANWPSVLK